MKKYIILFLLALLAPAAFAQVSTQVASLNAGQAYRKSFSGDGTGARFPSEGKSA